jgi:hypothetical protein
MLRGFQSLALVGRVIETRPWFAPCVIAAAASVCTLPLALFGFDHGDLIHLFWARHFSDQLRQGNLLPQWLLHMNSGLGSPTFYFYGPVSYYLTSIFFFVLPDHRFGWLQVGLSAAVASIGSGLTAYLWLRQRSSSKAACIAAILYTWLPYHLRIDHLERFAFAEYWGFVWMPLCLYFVSRLVSGNRRSIAGLAISYALLLMTHPPTALLFGCVPFLYALVLVTDANYYRPLGQVLLAMLLGCSLAAFYLFPALTTQSSASLDDMVTGYGYYANNFLYVKLPGLPGPQQQFFQEWLATMTRLTVVAASIAVLFTIAGLFGPRRRERIFWSAVILFSLAMMHPLSNPLWSLIPWLQKIQFPWRFHILVTLATTAMIAHAIDALPTVRMQVWRSIAFSLAMLLIGIDGLYSLKVTAWELLHKVNVRERYFVLDEGEYRPRWVPQDVFNLETIKQLGATTPLVQRVSGQGEAWIQKWSATGIEIGSNALSDLQVKIKQFYYPTWKATLENGDNCSTSASPTDGLLVISLPPGQHQIELKIRPNGLGLVGQRMSLIAGVIVLCLAFGLRGTPRTGRDALTPR